AVEMMCCGAHDYVLKDRLTRLAAAIEREMMQAAERRAKRRAEDLFHAVLRASPFPSAVVDRETGIVAAGSDAFRKTFLANGRLPSDRPLMELIQFSQPERVTQPLGRGS